MAIEVGKLKPNDSCKDDAMQVPLEEQLGELRKEVRRLTSRIEFLEAHHHLPNGDIVVDISTANNHRR